MEIDIGIPSSFTANLNSLIQRTEAASQIARAAAIFRVNTIYIYRDPITVDPESLRQVLKILRYINTPPYLRKALFPIDKDLSYAGLTPPLKTDLHKEWVSVKTLELPSIRLGIIKTKYHDKYIVDVGLDKYVVMKEKSSIGNLIPVELEKVRGKYIWGKLVDWSTLSEKGIYPGYKVIKIKKKLLSFLNEYNGIIIGTSKIGEAIWETYEHLKKAINNTDRLILLFGSFGYGLDKIFNYYNSKPNDICDFYVNIVNRQGVETIRVEEAVYIALSLIRFIENM